MAAPFTTWTAIYAALLDQAAAFLSGNFSVLNLTLTTANKTQSLQYRTLAEFHAGLEFAKRMADLERPLSTRPAGRTYARTAGRS